jgi:hypothetical protein
MTGDQGILCEAMTEQERRQLDERGYVLLENAMDDGLLRELRARIGELLEEEGDRAGAEFKRKSTRIAWRTWSTKARCSGARSCCRNCCHMCGTSSARTSSSVA